MKGIISTGVAGAALVLGAISGAGHAGAVPVGAVHVQQSETAVIDVRRGGRGGGGGFRGGGSRGGGVRGGFRGRSFGGRSFRGQRFRGPRFHRGVRRGFRRGRGWRYRRGHRRHRGPGVVFYGAPFLYYDEPYYYGVPYYDRGPCRWLRRRAVRSGSRYWWRRYRRCVRRYYD
jgi:hypothetical protein